MSNEKIRKEIIPSVRRVVLKLGSSVVTGDDGLDLATIEGLVDDVCRFKSDGREFVIVSSGAVAAGVKRMHIKGGPRTIPQKQAAAAVGQTRLMAAYEDAFAGHGVKVGQVLLTKDDLSHRRRYLNARNTLTTLLSWGVVPVVNENDTVMVEEIQLGDNDNLSAMVATLVEADLLIALTDREGFMDCDPNTNPDACVIPLVEEITPELREIAGDAGSSVGRGGMASKLEAAAKAGMAGVPTIIAAGKERHILPRIFSGEACGTLILPAKERISARKHWMRYNLEPEGILVVDSGAADALANRGKSLLPIGITEVIGHFEHGAAVSIESPLGSRVAVGLSNYSADEIRKIRGRQASEIPWILGYTRNDEAVHHDNMAIVES